MITQEAVLDIAREAIYTTIITSAPLLLISLIVGLIVSIFQTVTSIQEQTLTFVPKIIAIFFPISPVPKIKTFLFEKKCFANFLSHNLFFCES